MADMKITSGLPAAPVRPGSGARAEAVRNAQRAFFQAAMTEAQAAPSQAAPAKAKPAAQVEPAPAEPQRYLRPGSRVDIKV